MNKIYVAGHQGMVGSAILRQLIAKGEKNIVTRSHAELDLIDQGAVRTFLKNEKPDIVVLAAAKVGGIKANRDYPAEFIYNNLMIASNVIHGSFQAGVERLLQLGSSCIYPKETRQPMPEDSLLTGVLEPTNEPYAIAKIAGIKLCESYNRQYGVDYRSVMPSNLYGPGDNFHPQNSHVIPSLIQRFHNATLKKHHEETVWGTGSPLREFLHVDDMADAALFILDLPKATYAKNTQAMLSHINIGSGKEISIIALAHLIAKVVGFEGLITTTDDQKLDGVSRKIMDVTRLKNIGWEAKIDLESGLKQTYKWFLKNYPVIRR